MEYSSFLSPFGSFSCFFNHSEPSQNWFLCSEWIIALRARNKITNAIYLAISVSCRKCWSQNVIKSRIEAENSRNTNQLDCVQCVGVRLSLGKLFSVHKKKNEARSFFLVFSSSYAKRLAQWIETVSKWKSAELIRFSNTKIRIVWKYRGTIKRIS